MANHDREIIRDLARRYAEVAADPVQDTRRALWRDHNSLVGGRPLIYARVEGSVAGSEEIPEVATPSCEDPKWHGVERWFLLWLFKASLNDDFVFEPYFPFRALHACSGWGVETPRRFAAEGTHSFTVDHPIRELDDLNKLRTPVHRIREQETASSLAEVEDTIGDILTVDCDRAPAYRMWSGDISTDLGYLRGVEPLMIDIVLHPEWLHRFVAFLADGVEKAQAEAEAEGDWGLSAHENQSVPYARGLEAPRANARGVRRSQLWGYMASQEFEAASPDHFEEFLLRYQRPILAQYGLTAYGCCEDLTRKIDKLRSIGNLRRIAVSPRADLRACAEQIGTDYVISWRPNPARMIALGCDEGDMRRVLVEGLRVCRRLHVDVCLKDVTTVQNEPRRFATWVKVARQAIDEAWE